MEAFIHSLESPPAILCLTETWLNENDDYDAMLISGYSQYVIKNRKTRGGGVMIQLQNGYNIINQINSDFDEALFVDVIKNGTLIKLAVIYNPPRTNKLEFLNKLDSFLEENNNHNHPIVICGDLNIDIMKTNLVSKNYQNTIIANGFEKSEAYPKLPKILPHHWTTSYTAMFPIQTSKFCILLKYQTTVLSFSSFHSAKLIQNLNLKLFEMFQF